MIGSDFCLRGVVRGLAGVGASEGDGAGLNVFSVLASNNDCVNLLGVVLSGVVFIGVPLAERCFRGLCFRVDHGLGNRPGTRGVGMLSKSNCAFFSLSITPSPNETVFRRASAAPGVRRMLLAGDGASIGTVSSRRNIGIGRWSWKRDSDRDASWFLLVVDFIGVIV